MNVKAAMLAGAKNKHRYRRDLPRDRCLAQAEWKLENHPDSRFLSAEPATAALEVGKAAGDFGISGDGPDLVRHLAGFVRIG